MAGTWTVDPKTLSNLRCREAEKALGEGRLDDALIEAEELLDDQPSHMQALAIAGISALRMGDVIMALGALNRFVKLHTPNASILHALAVARFEAIEYPEALSAAEHATAQDPGLAAAWHYQGLALERMGKPNEARQRFLKAADLDSDTFPFPADHEAPRWSVLLERALDATPQPIQVFYDGVPIHFSTFPAIEDLLENYPPLSPFTDALYRGKPPDEGDPWVYRPKMVTLFKANLARPSMDEDELVRRITEALMHEAMHWLGIQNLPS